jgi:hypothetical protein
MEDLARPGPLAAVLDDAAAGRFPPADGGVTIVPPPSARDAGVIGFPGFKPVGAEAHLVRSGLGT